MNRFFINSQLINDKGVLFPEAVSHQILNVLRLTSGDRVDVLDDRGFVYHVELLMSDDERTVFGRIMQKELVTTEPTVRITLCFGLSNREKVEWILQKGTEIGVSEFVPFISSRTLVQSSGLSEKKKERWKRIIKEAAEQSHRGRLPKLTLPQDFETCVMCVCPQNRLNLIAWEEAVSETATIKDCLQGFDGTTLALFVGPEGGFSADEIGIAQGAGCQVISMGDRILRMETAAILLPGIVLFELGEI